MIFVGIDVAKDKHDCLILNSNSSLVSNVFTISNDLIGFSTLFQRIISHSDNYNNIKIGLEATGHYSNNITEFLLSKGFQVFIINPLHTSLYKKSQSFRKTKTDKVDTHSIVTMLMTQDLQPYVPISYHNKELKSLTRYRFTLVNDCSKIKTSFARLISIIFPELNKLIHDIQVNSIYQLMLEFPSAKHIANAHLTRLTNILYSNSKGHYNKDKAYEIRELARKSIGTCTEIQSFELQQTIERIFLYNSQIAQIESRIKSIMIEIDTPLITVPGISYITAAMIHAEVGDFSNFSSANKILAFAGMEPSIYQSGQYLSSHARMVKRGSKYLRFALYTAAKNVANFDPTFKEYLKKKRAEGKPYKVAISHVAKKILRVIYKLETTHTAFIR